MYPDNAKLSITLLKNSILKPKLTKKHFYK